MKCNKDCCLHCGTDYCTMQDENNNLKKEVEVKSNKMAQVLELVKKLPAECDCYYKYTPPEDCPNCGLMDDCSLITKQQILKLLGE